MNWFIFYFAKLYVIFGRFSNKNSTITLICDFFLLGVLRKLDTHGSEETESLFMTFPTFLLREHFLAQHSLCFQRGPIEIHIVHVLLQLANFRRFSESRIVRYTRTRFHLRSGFAQIFTPCVEARGALAISPRASRSIFHEVKISARLIFYVSSESRV